MDVMEMINRVVHGEDSKKVIEEFFQEEHPFGELEPGTRIWSGARMGTIIAPPDPASYVGGYWVDFDDGTRSLLGRLDFSRADDPPTGHWPLEGKVEAHHDWITPLQNYGFNWRTSTATEEFWSGALQARDYTIGIKGDDSWSITDMTRDAEGPAGSGQGLDALLTRLNMIQSPPMPSDMSLYD